MRTSRVLPYATLLIGLLVLALLGWMRPTPASAQDNNDDQQQAPRPVRRVPAPSERMLMSANGDYVFVLEGHTLYKLRAGDLSLAASKDLSRLTRRPAQEDQPAEQDDTTKSSDNQKDSDNQRDNDNQKDNNGDNPPR